MDQPIRIQFAGPSGIGKTTMAKALSEQYGIPFISGSYRDLVPETKEIPHSDMIQLDAQQIFEQDVQLLNARNKTWGKYLNLISDRSYVDSAAYLIQKLSHRIPQCDMEDFIEKCRILNLIQTTHLIFVEFTREYFTKWEMEDNGKRIVNKFYQEQMSEIMRSVIINHFGPPKYAGYIQGSEHSNLVYVLNGSYNDEEFTTWLLVLQEMDHNSRIKVINQFLTKTGI